MAWRPWRRYPPYACVCWLVVTGSPTLWQSVRVRIPATTVRRICLAQKTWFALGAAWALPTNSGYSTTTTTTNRSLVTSSRSKHTSHKTGLSSTMDSSESSCAVTSSLANMPPIGLGTYLMEASNESQIESLKSTIQTAIVNHGYRRIDCAPVYFNEHIIGDALHEILQTTNNGGKIRRQDLFIVSKLASPFHQKDHVELALRKTLQDLRLDYLDLYLIHWPVAFFYKDSFIDMSIRGYANEDIDDSNDGKSIDPKVSIHETWKAMEALVEKGLVRNIGVSNFPVMLLHELLSAKDLKIPPSVNQCESHPYLQQDRLIAYCKRRGVHFQAYSPLGTPGFKEDGEPNVLQEQILVDIGKTYNLTSAQVCLLWALQRGTSLVVKSMDPHHLEQNHAALYQEDGSLVQLSDEDMQKISFLQKTKQHRFFRPEDWWGDMAMAVFD